MAYHKTSTNVNKSWWIDSPETTGGTMKLRWYQTYDRDGRESEPTLQFRENALDEWEDVDFVRERDPDLTPQYED
jgi:hypothetical protein